MADEHDFFDDRDDTGNPLLRWREYLYVVYERRWIAITTFFVVIICTVIWNVRQTPIYRSSSTLHVDMFASKILDLPDPFTSGTPAYMYDQYINTQVKALQSHIFIEKVVQALQESNEPVAKAFLKSTQNPVGTILSGMTVKAVDKTRLIKITVQHSNAEFTALLANAVAKQFIEQDLNRRMEASLSALKWLKERAEDQKTKIEKSEQAIQDYREKSKMVSLEQEQDIVVSKLKAVSEALTEAENRYLQTKSQRDLLWNDSKDPIKIPIIASDKTVLENKKNVDDLEARIETLKQRYKSKHPVLIKAYADLKNAKAKYHESAMAVAERIDNNYKLAKENVEALRATLQKQEKKALELSRMTVEYNVLKRNAEIDKQLYQNILTRMKETDLAGKLQTTNIRINDLAHVPKSPFKPNKTKNIMVAVMAGAVLGVMLIVVVHMMDDRVRRIEDFEQSLQVPVLAMIPKIEMNTAGERAAVSFTNQDSSAAEAFRGFYASIMLDHASRDAKVILVVSAGASEGKSTVSSNLAITFAQNGQHTLLIDGDLRRPSLDRLFNVEDRKGLPSLIRGEISWHEAVLDIEQLNLDLITGRGVASGNPARLIASTAMDEVLKEARARYDRIIIDCPPLFGVSDPLILLPKVDGVIFVALYNKTHRRAAREATRKIIESETPLLGAVINAVDMSSHSYYYHRYGYNHYYGNKTDEAV